MKIENTNSANKEYKYFIYKFLFPLLGMPEENNIMDYAESDNVGFPNKLLFQNGEWLFFCNNREIIFKVQCKRGLDNDSINLAVNIIQMFFRISKFKMDFKSSAPNQYYYSDIQRKENYKMAVQKGICNWIVGANNESVEALFEILEKWSVQTYEGKKVTYGFIINPKAKSTFDDRNVKWLDFLEDDFSAVFTDCINSVIELDGACNFCQYLSVTENGCVEGYKLNHKSPYRFSQVIQKFVKENCIGVFLLNNGDIILSKNGEIRFVKRNLKWLNFSYNAFVNSLENYIQNDKMNVEMMQEVYASMLDVSFSHTGGIIAVTNKITELLATDTDNKPILDESDYLMLPIIDLKTKDMRMIKKAIIKELVGDNDFSKLDRKLRCELISLDGACIIDENGKVCACGAIIKNDSGSTGGGRGAAAKKLSKYGFAIKISTDGYIELYIDEKKIYSIK